MPSTSEEKSNNNNKKKVLIVGASGFLGQHLLSTIFSTNKQNTHYDVYATFHSLSKFEESIPHNNNSITFEPLDLTNPELVDSFIDKHGPHFDVCLFLAAISSPKICEQDPDKAAMVNVPKYFFQRILLTNDKPTTFVALSTDQVYGGDKGGSQLYVEDEDTPNPLNVYAKTKVALENHLLDTYSKNHSIILLRSSIILGEKAPFLECHDTFLHFCSSRKNEATTYFTDERRSVVSVDDVVASLLYFCDMHAGNNTNNSAIFNMGGSSHVSRFDMAMAVAEKCGIEKDKVVAALKTAQPQGLWKTPLNITMDSTKLQTIVQKEQFDDLATIVDKTFS